MGGMESTKSLIADMEAAASILKIAPSTLGERVGQGGRFYARLCEGARVWPETADKVREKIAEQLARRAHCEPSHRDGQELSERKGAP